MSWEWFICKDMYIPPRSIIKESFKSTLGEDIYNMVFRVGNKEAKISNGVIADAKNFTKNERFVGTWNCKPSYTKEEFIKLYQKMNMKTSSG